MPDIAELKKSAAWARRQILEIISRAGKGHIGGSLSCVDVLVTLYCGGVLNVRVNEKDWPERDRFLMSKGHAAEGIYAVLTRAGFISEEILKTYGADGSILGGHVDRAVPGIEISTGSLGQGLGIGAGLALSAKKKSEKFLTFVLMGDGECYEGSVWEAAMFAAHHSLSNLIGIVDRNREITLGETENINRLEPFADKWRSFGWEAKEVNGHSFEDLLNAFEDIRTRSENKPLIIIANTIKGKGVSFMEEEIGWHHNVPKGEKLERAKRELEESLASWGGS